MNKEYKITFSDFIGNKLSDLSVATGISEEDLIKNAVFQYVITF